MTARAPDLRTLQRWLSFVMRHPSTADVAVRSRAARALVPLDEVLAGNVVLGDERHSATGRMQVYNGGYLARLQEVLATDYGALQSLLGHDEFARLCAAYVERHPSRHPNLNRFGKQMPAFVRARRALPHRAFAAELATLECAISDSFDAVPCTPLDVEAIARIRDEDWGRARLQPAPSLRVLTFRHPTNRWYIAAKEGDDVPAVPAPQRTHVAVFRRDFRVFRIELEPRAHAVLAALVRGETLAKALERARGGNVGAWFRSWAEEGFFAAIRLGRRGER